MIVGRGVEKVEGRCGGQAVLVGTRLTVRCLDAMWRSGGDALVARQYPYLSREQRMAAYGYAEEHRAEIDAEDAGLDGCPESIPLQCVCGCTRLSRFGPYNPRSDVQPEDPGLVLIFTCSNCGEQMRVYQTSTAWREKRDKRLGAERAPHPWQESDDEIRAELAKIQDAPPDLMAAVDTPKPRRVFGPPPPISVRDMGAGGPYRLFVGHHGIATWPSTPALEDPKAYAEEVARCLRLALGVDE